MTMLCIAQVLAVVMCLCVCVCLSCPVLYQNGCTDQVDFCVRVSLGLCHTVFWWEIRISSKIMVLPTGALFQTLDVENFAMANRPSVSPI